MISDQVKQAEDAARFLVRVLSGFPESALYDNYKDAEGFTDGEYEAAIETLTEFGNGPAVTERPAAALCRRCGLMERQHDGEGAGDVGHAFKGPEYDFALNNQGTILILTALTGEARAWVDKNVSRTGFNPDLPNRVYVERRYVDALLDGIDGAGLTVDAIERALVER